MSSSPYGPAPLRVRQQVRIVGSDLCAYCRQRGYTTSENQRGVITHVYADAQRGGGHVYVVRFTDTQRQESSHGEYQRRELELC